jgi:hypothetical protein
MGITFPECPENIPNNHKYINNFQAKALENLPKLVFLV